MNNFLLNSSWEWVPYTRETKIVGYCDTQSHHTKACERCVTGQNTGIAYDFLLKGRKNLLQ